MQKEADVRWQEDLKESSTAIYSTDVQQHVRVKGETEELKKRKKKQATRQMKDRAVYSTDSPNQKKK